MSTGDTYAAYHAFCDQIKLKDLTQRAFSDMVSELDMYGFIQARVFSHGRYGRTKEIVVNLTSELSDKLRRAILMEFDMATTPKLNINYAVELVFSRNGLFCGLGLLRYSIDKRNLKFACPDQSL
jgi:hypothetical protein